LQDFLQYEHLSQSLLVDALEVQSWDGKSSALSASAIDLQANQEMVDFVLMQNKISLVGKTHNTVFSSVELACVERRAQDTMQN
jgi:hypothetical protein